MTILDKIQESQELFCLERDDPSPCGKCRLRKQAVAVCDALEVVVNELERVRDIAGEDDIDSIDKQLKKAADILGIENG